MPAGETPIIQSLQGKRVLVTGGSAGIGKATALQFDANGCKVAVLGRRLERLEAVVKQMKHGFAVIGDLTQAHDMERAVKEAIEKMGGLDILINNGGATNEEMMKGKGDEAYLAAFRLHVTGNLALIRAAEEELIKNKGSIVNVSSIAAQMPMMNFSAYCVAKAAADSLTKNLAFEFAPKGVRVNSVLPGTIDTEVFDSMAREGVTKEQVLEKLAVHHAMGRVAAPEEVAAPIVFLASESASFITGACLPVDGGALLGYWMNRTPIIPSAE